MEGLIILDLKTKIEEPLEISYFTNEKLTFRAVMRLTEAGEHQNQEEVLTHSIVVL